MTCSLTNRLINTLITGLFDVLHTGWVAYVFHNHSITQLISTTSWRQRSSLLISYAHKTLPTPSQTAPTSKHSPATGPSALQIV